MVHVVLLDIYQQQVDDDQFAVSYSGTLDYCRGQNAIPPSYQVWAKADFRPPEYVESKSLGGEPGRIAALQPVAALAAARRLRAARRAEGSQRPGMIASLAAAAAGGLLLGLLMPRWRAR
jgi:hypothetical protein